MKINEFFDWFERGFVKGSNYRTSRALIEYACDVIEYVVNEEKLCRWEKN